MPMAELSRTPLYDLHLAHGAKMVPFAGYEMPVQYAPGVMKEHLWTREHAGLFDVSHMGQVILTANSGSVDDAADALELLVPVSIAGLKEGRQRYALFTNDAGGILDDLMVARKSDHLLLVVNAACKAEDIAHLQAHLSDTCEVTPVTDRALIALQGPEAEAALSRLAPAAAGMRFMDATDLDWEGTTLRLEAGLCLYGNDIDTTTTPVEAALEWAIQKARRTGDRAGGFPGADIILGQFAGGAPRRRVGLLPEGRAPMRAGTELYSGDTKVGEVTSGAYGPSLEAPMSMGYVATEYAETGTKLEGEVRGKRMPVTVADMPFRPSTYKR